LSTYYKCTVSAVDTDIFSYSGMWNYYAKFVDNFQSQSRSVPNELSTKPCRPTGSGATGSYFFIISYFFIVLSGVRLGPLGTAATTGLSYQPQMIDNSDCGAVGGMKIGRGNRSTRKNLPQCHFVHHKFHMT
jgi:hypothetical protein